MQRNWLFRGEREGSLPSTAAAKESAHTQKSTASKRAVLQIPALVTGLPAIIRSVVFHRTYQQFYPAGLPF